MPVPLAKMKRDLARALELGDEERALKIREAVLKHHPDSEEAVEARYRLGLTALFRSRELEIAAEHLRECAKAKHPLWSPLARTSLGLILYREGKVQQALFELRKVASGKPGSLVEAQALGFIVIICRETGAGKEAETARGEQLKLLLRLTKSSEPEVQSMAHFLLGIEKKFDGMRDEAKAHLGAALGSGQLGPQETALAEAALRLL